MQLSALLLVGLLNAQGALLDLAKVEQDPATKAALEYLANNVVPEEVELLDQEDDSDATRTFKR